MKNTPFSSIPGRPITIEGALNVTARVLISRADGAPNFSMRMFELGPAGHTLHHKHPYEHVVYILEGTGELIHEGTTQPIAAGHAILVPPNEIHQFRNTGPGSMRFLCLIPNADAIPDKLK
ncbi:MAG: cupin domain-containing protein [Candidatus Brocadiia bacterium]